MIKNRNVGETLHDPRKMAIACGVIGMIVVTFLNLTASSVPAASGHRREGAGAGGKPAGEHRDAGDLLAGGHRRG
jgi:hypothetical protein